LSKLTNFCISARDDKLHASHDLFPGKISSPTQKRFYCRSSNWGFDEFRL